MASLVLVAVLAALCTVFVFLFRFLMVLRSGPTCKPGAKGSVCVLVVVGSGGHTTEVLRLMQSLSPCYQPRHYVLADTDRMSEEKIRAFESSKENADAASKHTVHRIPRPREVLQSWSSSVVSSLNALVHAVPLVFRLQPDMVLCNGPGTCIPLCAAGLLLGLLGWKRVVTVYVESVCRVETLSLTGKILYPLVDYFFVQWSTLRDKYPKAIFLGRIV